jgi:hypothetical protein
MVQQGQDPPELKPLSEKMVPTYGGDSLLRVVEATTTKEDKELMQKKAMELAKRYVQSPPNLPGP